MTSFTRDTCWVSFTLEALIGWTLGYVVYLTTEPYLAVVDQDHPINRFACIADCRPCCRNRVVTDWLGTRPASSLNHR